MLRFKRLIPDPGASIKYCKVFVTSARCRSTQTVANENTVETSTQDPNVRQNVNISTKFQSKLTRRQPLVKNFFLGKVDTDLLAFPEVISREDMSKLLEDIYGIRNYFEEVLSLEEINKSQTISASVYNEIKSLGLYGLNAPQNVGGHGYHFSESLMASEAETKCTEIASMLLPHHIVIDILNELGTDKQKDKYLTKLASGSLIGSIAIFEPALPQEDIFNTHIEYDAENKLWILKGEKTFVANGVGPNLFFVAAQKNHLNVPKDRGMTSDFCIVDSSTPGVTVKRNDRKSDGELQHLTVNFDSVILSEENMLCLSSEPSNVFDVFSKCERLRYSLVALGLSKKIVNDISEFSISNKQCGVFLRDTNLVRDKLSHLHCSTYALESLIFYTAGLIDEFDKQDVALETAITKFYAMSRMWKTACAEMELLGQLSLHTGEKSNANFRNAIQLFQQGEAIDTLKCFIGLTGLQHAGISLNDIIKKNRNPLFNPGHIFGKFFANSDINEPNTIQRLNENLHPSLEPAAQCLEKSITRLFMSVETLFSRYGSEIVQQQIEVSRIAEIVSITYAMFATLSRASRSYCIGLKLADHEMLLAMAICLNGRDCIANIANDIQRGPYVTNDNNLQRLSKQILKSHGYFSEHPLKYNY